MKFKDPQEMMERARLKVLISEMREKGARMEAELEIARAENPGYGVQLQSDTGNKNSTDGEQEFMKGQLATLDERIHDLHARIDDFQILVNQLVREVLGKRGLERELDTANSMIKELEDEVKVNARFTKAELLSMEQQLSDLEKSLVVVLQREKDYDKLLQILGDLEAEVTRLRQGNDEVLHHNKGLNEMIQVAKKRAEDMASRTMEDIIPEILELRSVHCELNKMVEYLQDSRFNEAEEILYLKWVNTCLFHNLETYKASCIDSNDMLDSRDKVVLSRKSSSKKTSSIDLSLPALKNNVDLLRKSGSFKRNLSLFADANVYSISRTSARSDSLQRSHKFASSSRYSYNDVSYTKVISKERVNNDRKSKFHHQRVVYRPDIEASSDADVSSRYYGSIDNMWNVPRFHEHSNMIASPSTSQRDSTKEFFTHSEKPQSRSSWKRSIRRFLSMGLYLEDPNTPSTKMEKMVQKDEGRTLRISTEIFSSPKISTNMNMKVKSERRNPWSSSTLPMKHLENSGMSEFKGYLENINSAYESSTSAYGPSNWPWYKESRESEILPLPIVTHEGHSSVKHNPLSIREQIDGSYKLSSAFKIFSKFTQMDTSILDLEDPPKMKHDHGEGKSEKKLVLEWYEPSSKVNTDDSVVQTGGMSNALTPYSQSSTSSTSNAFVRDLAISVQTTIYKCIEDVVAFIDWLDKQPDKEDFFSCKDWPAKRVDAMRWSGNEFENLKALESEINHCFKDEPRFPPDVILEHMSDVQKKAEKYIHDFMEARDWIISQLKKLNLPTDWMLDSGIIAKVYHNLRCSALWIAYGKARISPALSNVHEQSYADSIAQIARGIVESSYLLMMDLKVGSIAIPANNLGEIYQCNEIADVSF